MACIDGDKDPTEPAVGDDTAKPGLGTVPLTSPLAPFLPEIRLHIQGKEKKVVINLV